MSKDYPLIKKIEKIPIRTDKRHYVPKYLQHFITEIAKFYQKDHCQIFLFAKSTLLRGILLKTYKDQPIELFYVNSTPPWVTNKKIKQDIINIPDLPKLDRKDPLFPSIFNYFTHQIKSVLIIPINYNQATIGSIIFWNESETHLFTPDEIEILKQASAHLTTSLKKMVRQTVIDDAQKILYCINEYHQLLRQDEAQNKNPNIIVEMLKKVFYLKSVYIIKKNGSRGNRWYQADINENNEIKSNNGTFDDSTFEFMLEGAKKDRPDFIDVPIKGKGKIIGKLFIDNLLRENDKLFKKEIYRILLGTADALAQLMYT